jgi:integrase
MARKRANGEGSIKTRTVTRKDGTKYKRYYAIVSSGINPATGKVKRDEGSWRKTYPEAKADLKAMLERQEQGVEETGSKSTLSEYLDFWLEQAAPDLRPRSIQAYQGDSKNHIKPRIGTLKLIEITPMTVQQWQSALTKDKSAYVARKARACLSAALTQAVRWQLIAHNPCDGALNVKLPDHEADIWETSEARRFLETAQTSRYYLAFYLTLTLGFRIGELRGLKWTDLIMLEGMPHLHVQRTAHGDTSIPRYGPPKTARSNRILPVPADAMALLTRYRADQAIQREIMGERWINENLIITTPQGGAVTTGSLRDEYYRFSKEAGVRRIKWHELRHTAGSLWLESGRMSLQTVSARLGHSDVHITSRIYMHHFKESVGGSAMTLEEMLVMRRGEGGGE